RLPAAGAGRERRHLRSGGGGCRLGVAFRRGLGFADCEGEGRGGGSRSFGVCTRDEDERVGERSGRRFSRPPCRGSGRIKRRETCKSTQSRYGASASLCGEDSRTSPPSARPGPPARAAV